MSHTRFLCILARVIFLPWFLPGRTLPNNICAPQNLMQFHKVHKAEIFHQAFGFRTAMGSMFMELPSSPLFPLPFSSQPSFSFSYLPVKQWYYTGVSAISELFFKFIFMYFNCFLFLSSVVHCPEACAFRGGWFYKSKLYKQTNKR